MSKDFFDEEYDKLSRKQEESRSDDIDEWYNKDFTSGNNSARVSEPSRPKALFIVLTCFALILTFVLGWVLCALFGDGNRPENEKILSTVLDYLDNSYYQEITDAKMQQAVATAGTALLQAAGDQFCMLMSPQEYYNYSNQVDSSGTINPSQTYFGMGYTFQSDLGLKVSAVTTDSSCYGILQPGDVILQLDDITYTPGAALDLEHPSTIVVADTDGTTLQRQLAAIHSANFTYLRDGRVHQSGVIVRGKVGLEVPSAYNFKFLEFYFDSTHNNVSTTNQYNAKHNTYELRGLQNLPSDTGYVRITEFMYYTVGTQEVTVAAEFVQLMDVFRGLGLKRLILDLKGNPGGLVKAVCDIAGLLVTDEKLTDAEKSTVTKNDKLLITTLVPRDKSKRQTDYRTSTYRSYFDQTKQICDVVVWTDANSASASELLTGALRDYRTGFQIGGKTYGKGIAQTVKPLSYSGQAVTEMGTVTTSPWAIYYTFAAYYSPLGQNIHGIGYTPTDEAYNNVFDYVSNSGGKTLWDATFAYWNIH